MLLLRESLHRRLKVLRRQRFATLFIGITAPGAKLQDRSDVSLFSYGVWSSGPVYHSGLKVCDEISAAYVIQPSLFSKREPFCKVLDENDEAIIKLDGDAGLLTIQTPTVDFTFPQLPRDKVWVLNVCMTDGVHIELV